ncbi:Eco57I restriction-modification methylase domain-containing protein [candidate division KSB1 bacterium]
MANKKKDPNQLSLENNGKEQPCETKGLFSDHYLRTRLKETDVWPKDFDIKEPQKYCCNLIEQNKYRLSKFGNEEDTKQEVISKVLDILGFSFTLETPSPGSGKTYPDYLLFIDKDTKDAALNLPQSQRYSQSISLCEAKKYGHPLGAVSKTETPGRFPHNQIRDYLQNAFDDSSQKPFFNWAILTNGCEWRLYTRNAQTTSYLSIDLESSVQDLSRFKYFWILFNAGAFVRDEEGFCRLDKLRLQALDHQTQLETDLRKRVYKLLERLADGYFRYSENNITKNDLPHLYNTCLIFLYRLFFILYAEGRGLLPVHPFGSGANRIYREKFSLRRLRGKLKQQVPPEDDVFIRLYNEIEELFTLINGDNEKLNRRCDVPRYNGGLFDTARIPHWKIGDHTLTEVLKQLVYSPLPTRKGETFEVNFNEYIDYADLEVRQLGSIYEGLLEHHLALMDNGRLKLEKGSFQRKGTGSYYTPDYIVKYIIDQTLRSLLQRIEESESVKHAEERRIKDNSFANHVLKLRVLDPAMGSGHFLVRATEYLADEIAAHPTTALSTEKAPQGLSHDWIETAYWRRRVVESCIYGVDKNPLAVELAKLSLWLTCISSDQPLNFLDHHLRSGNSLVGSRMSDLNRLPVKEGVTEPLFQLKGLTESLQEAISSIISITAEASSEVHIVKQKETLFQKEVRERLRSFRAIADMRTAADFGIAIGDAAFSDFAADLNNNDQEKPSEETLQSHPGIWDSVSNLAQEQICFHWELEFPEVFGNSGGGFDAVIGNPPYVRQESLVGLKDYLEKWYTAAAGTADLYVPFIEKGINLLSTRGRFGMIVSNKWMRARYGEGLRNFVKQFQIEKLVDFGELKVFEDSATFPLIMIIEKHPQLSKPLYAPIKKLHPKKWEQTGLLEADVTATGFQLEDGALSPSGFALVNKGMTDIIEKMKAIGMPLDNYVNGKIYYGIKTGFNKAFVIDKRTRENLIHEDPKSEEIIKPFVVGDDIRKYQCNFRERYLIFARRGIDIDEYPAIKSYIQKWERQLTPKRNREDKTGRKPGNYQWYEIQDTIAYWEEFEKPKIVWPEIAMENRFAWDNKNYYFNKTSFIMPSNDFYLLGLLNSHLVWSFLKRICPVLGDPDKRGRLTQQKVYIEQIPIVKTNNEVKSKINKSVETVLSLKQEFVAVFGAAQKNRIKIQIEDLEREIDRLVYNLYGLSSKEIEIVESSI